MIVYQALILVHMFLISFLTMLSVTKRGVINKAVQSSTLLVKYAKVREFKKKLEHWIMNSNLLLTFLFFFMLYIGWIMMSLHFFTKLIFA
jgi:hypothetical protein